MFHMLVARGVSRISQRGPNPKGGGANLIFDQTFLKSKWKWRKLGQSDAAYSKFFGYLEAHSWYWEGYRKIKLCEAMPMKPVALWMGVQRKVKFSPSCHVISQIMWRAKMAAKVWKMWWIHAFLLLFILLNRESFGFRLNTRSKHYGGKLGEPAGEWQGELPPDQWFVQSLDHFNPSDTRTWKQVYI